MLTVSGLVNRMSDHGLLSSIIHTVLNIRGSSGFIDERINAAIFH
jgi:hypothetical protein